MSIFSLVKKKAVNEAKTNQKSKHKKPIKEIIVKGKLKDCTIDLVNKTVQIDPDKLDFDGIIIADCVCDNVQFYIAEGLYAKSDDSMNGIIVFTENEVLFWKELEDGIEGFLVYSTSHVYNDGIIALYTDAGELHIFEYDGKRKGKKIIGASYICYFSHGISGFVGDNKSGNIEIVIVDMKDFAVKKVQVKKPESSSWNYRSRRVGDSIIIEFDENNPPYVYDLM